MEAKNKKNNNYFKFGAIIFIWLLIIFGLSYAYFSIVFNNDDRNTTTVETGKLDVDFITSRYIDNLSMWPVNDSDIFTEGDKSIFSVARSADNTPDNVYYTISFTDIEITDNYSDSSDVKWALYNTDNPTSTSVPVSSGTFNGVEDGDSITLSAGSISLPDNVTHNYSLFIWISNSTENNQLELLDGELSGTISITAVTQ